jgi:hypothetical protein
MLLLSSRSFSRERREMDLFKGRHVATLRILLADRLSQAALFHVWSSYSACL